MKIKYFVMGLLIGLVIFIVLNLLSAQVMSDCGVLAVFYLDHCYDDIVRAGWPMQFYEEGGFAYRRNIDMPVLLVDWFVGQAFAVLGGFVGARLATRQKGNDVK